MKDIFGVLILLSFALVTAFVYNHFSPSGIPFFSQSVLPAKEGIIDSSAEIDDPEVVESIVKSKKMIILDARPRHVYYKGHIPGALSFPLNDFDDVMDTLDRIGSESEILVYCSGSECSDSHNLARQLKDMGFSNVMVYPGGFRQWKEEGYQIDKSE